MRDLERYAKDYELDDFERVQVNFRRKNVLSCLEKYGHRSILEVGCGLDSISNYVRDFEQFTIVEPIQTFADEANKPGLRVVCGTLEESVDELKGTDFDYIIVSSLLHEVEQPRELLKATRELAVAKTLTYFNVPNARSLHRLLGLRMGVISDLHERSALAEKFQRASEFDLQSLSQLLVEYDYEIIESGSYFIKPVSHEQMARALNAKIISDETLRGLEGLVKDLPEAGSEIYALTRLKGA